MNWKCISQILSLIGAGIGLCGFAGWVFGIDALKRIHPCWVTMKANTAVCLMLTGTAVALLRDENCGGWKRLLARSCATVVATVGLLTFIEHVAGRDFGIDCALFPESLEEAGRSIPGRMGPATALNFILLGAAIFLLDSRTRRGGVPAHFCVGTAAVLTSLIFLGYFYNIEISPLMVPYAAIALHTVVAFLVLCTAILLARPERGFVAIFLANNTGGIVARRMLPTALLAPGLLGLLFVLGHEAGYYGKGVATALLAATLTVTFATLVWWLARAIERSDVQRRSAMESLRRSERELSDFFDNAAVALHWVGPDGIVQRVNDTELKMLGYTREEYVGHHIAEFHASAPVIEDILGRLTAAETLTDYPAQLRCKDGSVRDVMIHSSVYWEGGKFIHTRCFTRDVTELKRTEDARARLSAIVASSGDAIISKDLEGVVTSWNLGAEKLYGYSADEMIGQSIQRIIPADREDEEREILRRVRAGEHIKHYETVRVTKEGRPVNVSVTISPIYDAAGAIIGASKIGRDITQRKQIEAELLAASDAAEAANRAKDDFLAALSHELRTPLTPVLMLAGEMEKSTDIPPAVRHDFAMIRKNVELEARIIDDLLDLTRITHGKLTLQSESVDVHALVEHALAILHSDCEAKKLAITLSLDANAHHVTGDAVRLQQIFWNVVKNAIKFTPQCGCITIRSWNENGLLRVAMTDTGIGITPAEMPHIFTAFAQGREAADACFGGLGLGLSISAHLIHEHRGRIWAESAGRNRGSTFHLELPLAATPAPDASAPSIASQRVRPLRILLVEDHEDTRGVLQRLMTRWGHNVTAAACVAEARAAIVGGAFDLLLSDVGLPDGSGYDVIAALREKSDAPAVAMSGYGMEADIARTHAAGFSEHLIKPVSADKLRDLLTSVAGHAGP